jgi:uncharacterized protein (UPF0297 family)
LNFFHIYINILGNKEFLVNRNSNPLGEGSDLMRKVNNTQYFKVQKDTETVVSDIIRDVYAALTEKGYNPVNQIVGYVMSGDPTYITSHKGARSLIMKVERDEIIEELLRFYIDNVFN